MTDAELRVLVLAPTGKDADLTQAILGRAGIASVACPSVIRARAELDAGAAAVLMTEELASASGSHALAEWLARQPPWSDLPVLVLCRQGADSPAVGRAMDRLGNVTVLERPVRVAALVSAVRTALRSRRRQYEAREHLAAQGRAADELRALLDTLPVGVFYAHDPACQRITANRAGNALLRTPAGSNISKTGPLGEAPTHFRPCRDGVEIPADELPVQRAARGETIRDMEVDQVFADGTVAHTVISATPLFDAAGAPRGALATITDVTARKRAEQALRASEERFRALVTASSDVLYQMNGDWSELLPLDGRGLVPGNDAPIRGWMEKNLPAFEHPRVRAAIAAAVAGRTTFELEHQVIRPDGSAGWTLSRAVPLTDHAGRIVEWFGAATDITARKRAEAEVARLAADAERERRLFAAVLSNTPDFIYTFDRAGRFVYVNAALLALWDKRLDEAVGRDFHDLDYPPDLADRLHRQIREVIDTRQPVRDETPYTNRAGERMYEYIFAPVVGADGTVEAVAGSTRDITDRKLAEQERERLVAQLRDQDRRKDEFLATLAHELRNPLAPIRNSLPVLRAAAADPAVGRVVAMIDRQVAHMVRLDDLLEVSRVTRGKIDLRREPVALVDVVRAAVETSRPLLDAAGHRLTVTVTPDPPTVDGDPVRLAQVFANLLNNAAKYTEPGGHVRVSIRRDRDAVEVAVRDDGVGIAADMLPRVFDLFTQVNRTDARSQGGLGIGLTLVKSLVELHGGTVRARSEGPGAGSEFTVRLPLAAAPPPSAAPPLAPAASLGGRRVLVVDDNRDAAESLGLVLEMLGAEVRVAHGGPEALAAAGEFRPAAVLMDVGMPGMSGHEVARQMRRRADLDGVTLIALTGWGQEEDRRQTAEAGFDHHLTKPADLGTLERLLVTVAPTRE